MPLPDPTELQATRMGATDEEVAALKLKIAALRVGAYPPYRYEPGRSPSMESSGDGKVTRLDPMPDLLEFSLHLIAMTDLPFLEVRNDVIDLQFVNGRYVYRIVESRVESETVVGELVYREDR